MGKFTVIRDTREKKDHGWWFEENTHCLGTEVAKLDIGDYAIKGKENILCIERKESVAEFAGNCSEKRFFKELKSMANFPHKFLLLEFGWHQIELYPAGSGIPRKKWASIRIKAPHMKSIITKAQVDYGIHVLVCNDKKKAEEEAMRIMRYVNDI